MARELPSLGELEIRVLRLVWQQQPCTERQITDVIQQERSLGRTTVLKLGGGFSVELRSGLYGEIRSVLGVAALVD